MSKIPPVSPSTPLKDVAKHLKKYKTPIVAVTDNKNVICGAIYISTLIKPFIPDFIDYIDNFSFISNFGALEQKIFSGEMSALFLAEDVMDTDYPSIEETDSAVKALFAMHRENVTGLIVKKGNLYRGIILRCDLLDFLYGTNK